MVDPEEIEPSRIIAIRLARMRDGNMGQSEEIKAVMDIPKGSPIHIKYISLKGDRNNNKMERLNGEFRDRGKVMRG